MLFLINSNKMLQNGRCLRRGIPENVRHVLEELDSLLPLSEDEAYQDLPPDKVNYQRTIDKKLTQY